MAQHHLKNFPWLRYSLGLGMLGLTLILGLVAYQLELANGEALWGSLPLDTGEGVSQIGEASDAPSATAAPNPVTTADAADPGPIGISEIGLSARVDPVPPPLVRLDHGRSDLVGAIEPTSLSVDQAASADGNSSGPPVSVMISAPSVTGAMEPNGISGADFPVNPSVPTGFALGGKAGGAPPQTRNSELPRVGVGPQIGSNPTSPTIPTSPSIPASATADSPQPTFSGGPTSQGSAPSHPVVLGQTPANPTTPIGNTPNGSSILPITGEGCVSAHCSSSAAWQFFDPPVAIGYDYQLNPTIPGQPLTFGITKIMPTTTVGSGIYDLWLYDVLTGVYIDSSAFSSDGKTILIAADPTANPSGAFDVVSFLQGLTLQEDKELGISDPLLGLTQFSLRGIDPKAGLDPTNPNAFITGLLFAGDINGDLLITPLAIDSSTDVVVDPVPFEVTIPEPTTIALFLAAFVCLGFLRWRRKIPISMLSLW